LYADTDPGGHDEYTVIPSADPATFTALTQLAVVEKPTQKDASTVTALGTGSGAYYQDKNNGYMLSVLTRTGPTQDSSGVGYNASLDTFKVMGPVYAQDAAQVYALQAPSDATTHAPGVYNWQPYDMKSITNAVPAPFVLASGSTYDAHDAAHAYRAGVEI